ncbi:MAG TPA: hypothetical protein VFV38_39775 [Ktedonobacteraceae bacterium]|nr:hypothetical protein [Ktedonobacteraceae bacterium]
MDQAYPSFAPQLPPTLIEALQEPFSHLDVELRPGPTRQKQPEGTWFCQAVLYVPRWVYEARLDQLVPGGWSSSSPSFAVASDHLTLAAQVQIGSISHTSYGEVCVPRAWTPNSLGEVIASAPDAYTFAFIDVCHRFGLGRYLARLERKWVPYDPERCCIALSREKQREHIVKLYEIAGLSRDLPATPLPISARAGRSMPTRSSTDAPVLPHTSSRVRERDLAWVRENITGKPLENLLRHFKLTRLEDIADQDLASVITGTIRHRLPKAS